MRSENAVMRALIDRWLPRQFWNETFTSGTWYTGTYDVTSHVVTTEDDYILKMFRLLPSNAEPGDNSRPVVFLQHGLVSCSETWVGSKEDSWGKFLSD